VTVIALRRTKRSVDRGAFLIGAATASRRARTIRSRGTRSKSRLGGFWLNPRPAPGPGYPFPPASGMLHTSKYGYRRNGQEHHAQHPLFEVFCGKRHRRSIHLKREEVAAAQLSMADEKAIHSAQQQASPPEAGRCFACRTFGFDANESFGGALAFLLVCLFGRVACFPIVHDLNARFTSAPSAGSGSFRLLLPYPRDEVRRPRRYRICRSNSALIENRRTPGSDK